MGWAPAGGSDPAAGAKLFVPNTTRRRCLIEHGRPKATGQSETAEANSFCASVELPRCSAISARRALANTAIDKLSGERTPSSVRTASSLAM